VTYDPGLIGGPATAPLGYATTFILQNANPLNPPTPGLITDTCGLFNAFTQAGLASGGGIHRSNPGPGTNLFFFQAGSGRDADQGPSAPAEPTLFPLPGGLSGFGLVNGLDTCPFTPNHGSPLAPAGSPFNGDGLESPGDGIDAACDPNPNSFDGSDVDLDGYLNRGDNCPLVANGAGFGAGTNNQSDVSEVGGPPAPGEVGQQPVDGGLASDAIGDSCDFNLAVPDGHFHTALLADPVCVGLADSDGDGWCDLSEGGLGSNPASATSTPEALAVPGSCSDGADNDGDGNTDLNDGAGGPAAPTGCQLPLHDIAIKKVNRSPAPFGDTLCADGSSVAGYVILLQNNGPVTQETVELGVMLDSVPSTIGAPGKSAGFVSAVSKGTITASGPINIDGDTDVEWLTKISVTGVKAGSTTPVHVTVTFTACAAGPDANAVDYTVTTDACHIGDIAPLGLFGAGACAGASDGGQDRNTGNDAPVSRSVNDVSR